MDASRSSPSPATLADSHFNGAKSVIHPASLVEPSQHNERLMQMINLHMSESIIDYIVGRVTYAVDLAMEASVPTELRGSKSAHRRRSSFAKFIARVIRRSRTPMPVILVALVYIDRAIPDMSISSRDWALEAVFLGAVVVAYKYVNDYPVNNNAWAICNGLFDLQLVNRLEREFLDIVSFRLHVTEPDILMHRAIVYHRHHESTVKRSASCIPYRRAPVHSPHRFRRNMYESLI